MFILSCYTNTTGNSIEGWTISLFYSAAAQFFPVFQCALNDRELELCMLTRNSAPLCLKTPKNIFRY